MTARFAKVARREQRRFLERRKVFPPATGDIPGTTIGTQKESLQPQETATESADSKAVESGDGGLSELEYPKAMSMAERDEARKKLASIPASLAQQHLDELAASIGANVIQTTSLAYLRGLITREWQSLFRARNKRH